MREKYKSQLEKHGEGASHEAAVKRLFNVLIDAGWNVYPDAIFDVEWDLRSQGAFKLGHDRYYHQWDIYAQKEHDFKLYTQKIFEIDGSSHEKKKQQNRDDTAEKYAEFFLPNCPVYRVPIAELIGNHKLTDAELWILYKLR